MNCDFCGGTILSESDDVCKQGDGTVHDLCGLEWTNRAKPNYAFAVKNH